MTLNQEISNFFLFFFCSFSVFLILDKFFLAYYDLPIVLQRFNCSIGCNDFLALFALIILKNKFFSGVS